MLDVVLLQLFRDRPRLHWLAKLAKQPNKLLTQAVQKYWNATGQATDRTCSSPYSVSGGSKGLAAVFTHSGLICEAVKGMLRTRQGPKN